MVFCGCLPGPSMRSRYSSNLKSYISACRKDTNLKSFDSSLHQRTNTMITSLATRAEETQSLSLDSLMEVYGFLLELNQNAVNVIIESREDVMKNKDLKSLVDVYFKSTSKTLDFCNTVETCVTRAEISQRILRLAVKQFEIESMNTDLEEDNKNKKKKYAKTLAELNRFKFMGDPFDEEFLTQYESVYREQVLLLEELRKLKTKLYKKRRNVKTWRTLSNVVFVSTLVSVLVLTLVTAAMNAPGVVGVVGAVAAVAAVMSEFNSPIEKSGQWCSKMWKKYEKVVKRQRSIVLSTESRAQVNYVEMEGIRVEVDKLRGRVSSIFETVELALEITEEEEESEALRDGMERIKKQVEEFTEKTHEVGKKAAKYRKVIDLGRLLVLEHILRLPVNEEA